MSRAVRGTMHAVWTLARATLLRQLRLQLGHLVLERFQLVGDGPLSPDQSRPLGKARYSHVRRPTRVWLGLRDFNRNARTRSRCQLGAHEGQTRVAPRAVLDCARDRHVDVRAPPTQVPRRRVVAE